MNNETQVNTTEQIATEASPIVETVEQEAAPEVDEDEASSANKLREAAQRQTNKKYQTKVISKKKLDPQGNIKISSLESLSSAFDNERVIIFNNPNDDEEDITFRISVMDPGKLLLETSSPAYFKFAQDLSTNLDKDPDYIDNLPEEMQVSIIKEDYQHKYRVVVQGVLEPKLGMEGSEGFPVEQLPTEILTELYNNIMSPVEEGQDALNDFLPEESGKGN